jgi:predicted MFS family arabinose efflux permease
MTSLSARPEWASAWPLPIVAMFGVAGSVIFPYSGGILMQEMTTTFGWSRTQFSTGFFVQTILNLITLPVAGWLVDRMGSRRVVLLGIVPYVLSLSLFELANGAIWQWWLLCALLAACQALVCPPVWVTAVVGRFHASRGLALAVTLAGLGVGTMIWPVLAAFYLRTLGWRTTFAALALSWAVVAVPMTWKFFFGPSQSVAMARAEPRSYGTALRSRTFLCLIVASGLFSSAYFGAIVHLVPLLRANGLDLATAASVSGLAGLFGIIGRLSTGYLLDRLPTRPIGVVVFLSPILTSGLLLSGRGSLLLSAIAVALLGLAVGAEYDIVTFIAARRFGREVFGSIYSIFTAIIALCSALGPILAGAVFDRTGSYDLYLVIMMPMVLAGAMLIARVPLTPPDQQATAAKAPA